MWSTFYQMKHGETLDNQCQCQRGKHSVKTEYQFMQQISRSNSSVLSFLMLTPEVLRLSFLYNCLYFMPVNLKKKCGESNYTKFRACWEKTEFSKIIFTQLCRHFGRRFYSWINWLPFFNPRPPEPFSITRPPKGGLLQPPLDFL